MNPQQSIIIQLVTQEGRPLEIADVYFWLYFYIQNNFRYCFGFGPTGTDGHCRVNFEDVERERKASGNIFLMDYNTPLLDCDDKIRVKILTGSELIASYDSATEWYEGVTPEYAKPWSMANNAKIKAEDVFADLHEGENLVKVCCHLV